MDGGGNPLVTGTAIAALAFVAAVAFGWLNNDTGVAPRPLEIAVGAPPLHPPQRAIAASLADETAESPRVLSVDLHEAAATLRESPVALREPDSNSGESARSCLETYRRFVERHFTSDACRPAPRR